MTDDVSIEIVQPDDSGLEFVPAIRLFGQHGDPDQDPQAWSTVSTSSGGDWDDIQVGAEIVWTVIGLTLA